MNFIITPFALTVTLQSYPLSTLLASIGGFLGYIPTAAILLGFIHTKMFERSIRNNMMKENILENVYKHKD
jgi:hypothetical protein